LYLLIESLFLLVRSTRDFSWVLWKKDLVTLPTVSNPDPEFWANQETSFMLLFSIQKRAMLRVSLCMQVSFVMEILSRLVNKQVQDKVSQYPL
jgi:hypothetical protein